MDHFNETDFTLQNFVIEDFCPINKEFTAYRGIQYIMNKFQTFYFVLSVVISLTGVLLRNDPKWIIELKDAMYHIFRTLYRYRN